MVDSLGVLANVDAAVSEALKRNHRKTVFICQGAMVSDL